MKLKSKTLEKTLKSKFDERKWTQKKTDEKYHKYKHTLESDPKEYDKFEIDHLKKYDKYSGDKISNKFKTKRK
jgi:hypothetical protein